MTRIASKFGIAAALTLGMLSTAAAQTTRPTTTVGVSKGEVVTKPETVTVTRVDTVRMPTVYRTDTLRLTGATVTRWDTVTVSEVPGWLAPGNGAYFGLGGGSYYPSAGIGQGQIPGYAVQMQAGIDPAGMPLGARITFNLARPDETSTFADLGPRPTLMNFTGDLKLRLPFFSRAAFPNLGLYAIGGLAYIRHQGLRQQPTTGNQFVPFVEPDGKYHDTFGYTAGGGFNVNLGHKRELFLEGRVINFNRSGFEGAHQAPFIVGLNWY